MSRLDCDQDLGYLPGDCMHHVLGLINMWYCVLFSLVNCLGGGSWWIHLCMELVMNGIQHEFWLPG